MAQAEHMIWGNKFGYGIQSTYGTAVNCSAGIALTNLNADFTAGIQTVDQRKALGNSYRDAQAGREFQIGLKTPETTFEFDVSPDNVMPILWSFFQKSAIQDADPYAKYYWAYDRTVTDVWLTLVKYMGAGEYSHRLKDCVCDSITFTCEEGQPLKASAHFISGAALETNRDGSSDTFTVAAIAPLMFQDATFDLDTIAVNMPTFTITLNNNARVVPYDNQTGTKIILGALDVTGSFQVPWSQTTEGGNNWIDNFTAGPQVEATNPKGFGRISIWWGTQVKGQEIANALSEFSIISNFVATSANPVGDDETLIEVGFTGARTLTSDSVVSGTTVTTSADPVVVVTAQSADAALSTNFKYGDIFYLIGAAAAGDQVSRIVKSTTSTTVIGVYPAYSQTDTEKNYRIDRSPITITLCDDVDQNSPDMDTFA